MKTITQATIVPAYVWADEKQRTAVSARAAAALLNSAKRHDVEIDGDVLDVTSVDVKPLQAEVGHATLDGSDVAFVAYEPCEPALADLIFVTFIAPLVES